MVDDDDGIVIERYKKRRELIVVIIAHGHPSGEYAGSRHDRGLLMKVEWVTGTLRYWTKGNSGSCCFCVRILARATLFVQRRRVPVTHSTFINSPSIRCPISTREANTALPPTTTVFEIEKLELPSFTSEVRELLTTVVLDCDNVRDGWLDVFSELRSIRSNLTGGCGWESLMKNVTLGNVTMSHRTRERPAECLASLSHSTMIGLPRAQH
ncbi:hypothetical protein EVAR_85238_1 [Eumeta japonica]|uniref:Uncharacterized protein n=1 Tax=Eumeta variegata TaxID=151549 RepID=A0A4C1W1N8_EUMVA|nr:hypothetical protein EVAR_85238_1 [Eumeta japonica]